MRSKKVKYQAYEGIYRNVWSDEVVARFGNTLISFGVRSDSPLKWRDLFIPEKTGTSF